MYFIDMELEMERDLKLKKICCFVDSFCLPYEGLTNNFVIIVDTRLSIIELNFGIL